MTDNSSKKLYKLAFYRIGFLCGQTREGAKAQWGTAFDDKLWDYVEKMEHVDPEEECAKPHPRDILKREYDQTSPRNEALEKWGAEIAEMIQRKLTLKATPEARDYGAPGKSEPDLDRE